MLVDVNNFPYTIVFKTSLFWDIFIFTTTEGNNDNKA